MKKLVIGLTGGIGSGKTTVSDIFVSLGVHVVDADIVAREAVEVGSPGLIAIIEKFGNSILLNDGSLNRAALRSIVFSDEQNKQWLNQLLHPMIRNLITEQLEQGTSSYSLLVAPLLFENKLEHLIDRSLVVDVAVEIQLARAVKRDSTSTEQEIKQIIACQISREERLEKADDVISNTNLTIEEIKGEVTKLHLFYNDLAMSQD